MKSFRQFPDYRFHRSSGRLPCLRRPIHRSAGTLVVSLLAAVLTACAGSPPQYQISAAADGVINRDNSGQPLSVVIRLYQLKGRRTFDQLTFDAAASGRDERELFGDELLTRTELVMVPGSTNSSSEPLNAETRYVGITALFRQPDAQNWRYLVDAATVRKRGLKFFVQDCHLKILEPGPLTVPGQSAGHYPECRPPQPVPNQRASSR